MGNTTPLMIKSRHFTSALKQFHTCRRAHITVLLEHLSRWDDMAVIWMDGDIVFASYTVMLKKVPLRGDMLSNRDGLMISSLLYITASARDRMGSGLGTIYFSPQITRYFHTSRLCWLPMSWCWFLIHTYLILKLCMIVSKMDTVIYMSRRSRQLYS